MELVAVVIALALLEYIYISFQVGAARGKYGVPAPAVVGNEIFERTFRVHQNTMEQLVVFVPAIVMFGLYLSPAAAAGIGVVFLVGRLVYLRSYVKDPDSRTVGFLLGFASNVVLLVGGLVGALIAYAA